MVRVAISLGSNLGDRRAHLIWALDQLRAIITNLEHSEAIETEPFDVPEPQPPYLNMAATGESSLAPDALIAKLLDIEKRGGRERRSAKAARTIDLDVILYGDRIIATPAIVVPHPRFRGRRFVLEPLAAIAPDWADPVTGRTVRELLEDLDARDDGVSPTS
jgi:2-amino-4-hydroxy-6-hydroxymethyldihydropteridine diphosphokinase